MTPVIPPPGAVCWAADIGWLFTEEEAARALDEHGAVYVVGSDQRVDVGAVELAPVSAVMRADTAHLQLAAQVTDLQRLHAQLAQRVSDLGDTVAGIDMGESVDVSDLRSKVAALAHRVVTLEARE